MGTWGAAIFADDFACDVREAYLDKLANGVEVAVASRAMIDEYGGDDDADADADEGPVFWLALAATQWEYGGLDETVKRRALEILDAGSDSLAWTESGRDPKRVAVLATLARKLRTPPPRARRPRPRTPIEIASHGVDSPDRSAHASANAITDNLTQVMIEIPSLGGGGGVFTAECALDEIRLRWRDDATLEISYPAAARVQPEIGDPNSYFLHGRTIAIVFEKRRG